MTSIKSQTNNTTTPMLNLVLFGPPGAGKGTQSEKLIEKYKLAHISTGDLLRAEISMGTPLGLEAKKNMDQGQLVPDEVVIGMIANKLANNTGSGFIFDGFPRTIAQAEALDKLMEENNISICCMVALQVEKDELVSRLLNRGKESGRSDDNEETILKRIDVYEANTRPVADYYQAQNKLHAINGFGSIYEIFDNICSIVDTFKA